MASKSALVPERVIAFNESILCGSNEPVAVNHKKAARHLECRNVFPSRNLSSVFGQPSFERRMQRFSCIDELPFPIQDVHAFFWRRDVFAQWVLGAGFQLFGDLSSNCSVNFEDEAVSVTQGVSCSFNQRLRKMMAATSSSARTPVFLA